MMADVGIHRKGEVNLPQLLARLRADLGKEVGAIGCFIGIVRGQSGEGEKVQYLSYEAAEEAMEKLEKIAKEIERRYKVKGVMIHHVVDEVSPGEDAIYVLVAGAHRGEVFKALPEIMDRVKTDVPIWKKEVTKGKGRWGHEYGHKKRRTKGS